jgi:rRNA maturation endonuclease Nob1
LHSDGPRPGVMRVEKKIKVRVRHSCHQCATLYTKGRICSNCGHNRCLVCPREPARRLHDRSQSTRVDTRSQLASMESQAGQQQQPSSSTPNQQGPPPTYAPIVQRSTSEAPGRPFQRVQSSCHRCESSFVPGTAHHCPNCGHQKCDLCPRQLADPVLPPENLEQMITVVPRTAESHGKHRVWRAPRQRFAVVCHECTTPFKYKEPTCATCSHRRCRVCARIS